MPQGRPSLQESERPHREASFYRNGERTRTGATIRSRVKPAVGSKGLTSHPIRMPGSGRACRSVSERSNGSLGTILRIPPLRNARRRSSCSGRAAPVVRCAPQDRWGLLLRRRMRFRLRCHAQTFAVSPGELFLALLKTGEVAAARYATIGRRPQAQFN